MVISAGNAGIGTVSPGSKLHALLSSAATNAVTNVLTIGHDTNGTAAAGFGAGQLFNLESSTTAAQSAARIQAQFQIELERLRRQLFVVVDADHGVYAQILDQDRGQAHGGLGGLRLARSRRGVARMTASSRSPAARRKAPASAIIAPLSPR